MLHAASRQRRWLCTIHAAGCVFFLLFTSYTSRAWWRYNSKMIYRIDNTSKDFKSAHKSNVDMRMSREKSKFHEYSRVWKRGETKKKKLPCNTLYEIQTKMQLKSYYNWIHGRFFLLAIHLASCFSHFFSRHPHPHSFFNFCIEIPFGVHCYLLCAMKELSFSHFPLLGGSCSYQYMHLRCRL